ALSVSLAMEYAFMSFMSRQKPSSSLFPYTTLFRSQQREQLGISEESYQRNLQNIQAPNEEKRKVPGLLDQISGAATSLARFTGRSEEHTSELQSRENLVCRLLLEKNKRNRNIKRRC